MKDFIVISFATTDKYKEIGERFERNMQRLEMPYDMEYVNPVAKSKPNGRLMPNSRHKKDIGRKIRVKYILRKLQEHRKPVLWLDCDDGLTKKIALPDGNYDFGYVDNPYKIRERLPITAGVLYFDYTDNGIHFLKVWDYLCAWDELECMGGNHIRLIHTRNICFDEWNAREMKFHQLNLTPYIMPYWRRNLNRK